MMHYEYKLGRLVNDALFSILHKSRHSTRGVGVIFHIVGIPQYSRQDCFWPQTVKYNLHRKYGSVTSLFFICSLLHHAFPPNVVHFLSRFQNSLSFHHPDA